jgi:hypothetical protein
MLFSNAVFCWERDSEASLIHFVASLLSCCLHVVPTVPHVAQMEVRFPSKDWRVCHLTLRFVPLHMTTHTKL